MNVCYTRACYLSTGGWWGLRGYSGPLTRPRLGVWIGWWTRSNNGVSPYPTIPFPILPHHTRAFHCIPGGEGNRCGGPGHRVLLHSHPGGEEAGVARNRLHLRPWRGKWTTEDCQHSLDLPSRWRIKAACVFPSLHIRNGVSPWRSQSLSFLLKHYFHIARKC